MARLRRHSTRAAIRVEDDTTKRPRRPINIDSPTSRTVHIGVHLGRCDHQAVGGHRSFVTVVVSTARPKRWSIRAALHPRIPYPVINSQFLIAVAGHRDCGATRTNVHIIPIMRSISHSRPLNPRRFSPIKGSNPTTDTTLGLGKTQHSSIVTQNGIRRSR